MKNPNKIDTEFLAMLDGLASNYRRGPRKGNAVRRKTTFLLTPKRLAARREGGRARGGYTRAEMFDRIVSAIWEKRHESERARQRMGTERIGLTQIEISQVTGLPERTVRYHLKRIKVK